MKKKDMKKNKLNLKNTFGGTYKVQWLIEPSKNYPETVDFYKNIVGLQLSEEGYAQTDFHFNRYAQFTFENGIVLEIVEPKEQYKDIFVHPIRCLRVDDLEMYRKELIEKGVVFISEILASDGWGWTYFKGTDERIVQLEGPYQTSQK